MVDKKDSRNKETVVLAYSGGLDTSVLVRWLCEEKGLDVIALAVNVGQPEDMETVRRKAQEIGAVRSLVIDARQMFAREFIVPALHANALYQGQYPLATALARPLIARLLVETAREFGATRIAHGCTGKGNDQVRFEVASAALDPSLEVMAPMREWKMSREEEMEYARHRGIPVPVSTGSPYSVDENLWGRSCECGVLEDPWEEPPEDAYGWTVSPVEAPGEPLCIEVEFESGIPVSLNGERAGLVDIITTLNRLGGENAVGRVDVVEDRVVGIKSREIYEAPAAEILIRAHRDLEKMTLTRETLAVKSALEQRMAELIYDGLWYSPLTEAIKAFNSATQRRVTGTTRIRLYKGSAMVVGRKSPYSLYDAGLATYDRGDLFDHSSAKGFIDLWGLPLRVWARVRERAEEGEDDADVGGEVR